MKQKTVALAVFGSTVAIVTVGLYANWIKPPVDSRHTMSQSGHNSLASYGRNFADDRIMVGESHFVFVGKIIRQIGNEFVDGIPATQFEVEPLLNIKGMLDKTIILAQMGVSYDNGKLTSYEGDKPLVPGATYLFATQYGVTQNGVRRELYAISAPQYDRALIADDPGLTNDDLKALAERNERVTAYQNAYPNEMPPKGAVEHGTAWNNYQSFQSGHLLTPPSFEASPATNAPAGDSVSSPIPSDAPTGDVASPTAAPATDSPAPSPVDSGTAAPSES